MRLEDFINYITLKYRIEEDDLEDLLYLIRETFEVIE